MATRHGTGSASQHPSATTQSTTQSTTRQRHTAPHSSSSPIGPTITLCDAAENLENSSAPPAIGSQFYNIYDNTMNGSRKFLLHTVYIVLVLYFNSIN